MAWRGGVCNRLVLIVLVVFMLHSSRCAISDTACTHLIDVHHASRHCRLQTGAW